VTHDFALPWTRRLTRISQAARDIPDRPPPPWCVESCSSDQRWKLQSRLEHRYDRLPEHGPTIVFLHVGAVVAPDAILQQDRMVMVEQRSFQPLPAFRIPMDGHHVGQIAGRNADAPTIPIEPPHVVASIPGQEAVPHMSVTMSERDVPGVAKQPR
jgi:hypothetical protein